MNQSVIHVYMIPGMAANSSIFENIVLPDHFKIHYLEWILPKKDETLQLYANRMTNFIKHKNPVIIGVSFGGILAQEIAKIIDVRRVIIISSMKSSDELPAHLKFLKITRGYNFLPTNFVSKLNILANFTKDKSVIKLLELYNKYLTFTESSYIDWSIKMLLFWNQKQPLKKAIYINGSNDKVFPDSKHNSIIVKSGTHIMIINRFKWFNEHLPKLI